MTRRRVWSITRSPNWQYAVISLMELIHHRLLHYIHPFDPAGLLDYLARVFQNQPGDVEQFAISGFLLRMPLLGGHPLEGLHAAASATGAVGETLHPAGQDFMQILDQSRNGAHRVPQ
jgi:hypothetical protein